MIEHRSMGRLATAAALALSAACASGDSAPGAPGSGDTLLADLLASRPDLFADVLEDPAAHRLKMELVVVEEGAEALGSGATPTTRAPRTSTPPAR